MIKTTYICDLCRKEFTSGRDIYSFPAVIPVNKSRAEMDIDILSLDHMCKDCIQLLANMVDVLLEYPPERISVYTYPARGPEEREHIKISVV